MENKTIDQFPPPPYYYKKFVDNITIQPPQIQNDIENSVFPELSGIVNSQNVMSIESIASVGEDLRILATKALNLSLDGALSSSPQSSHELKEVLSKFYSILRAYREHESRELLCLHLQAQVNKAERIRDEMKVLIRKYTGLVEVRNSDSME